MYQGLLILAGLLAAVTAGRSPYADRVEKFAKGPDGSRYSSNIIEDGMLDLEGVIRKYQYPFEAHNVVTEDGYILTAQRIPHGIYQNTNPGSKRVVVLMHGLLSSAADYVLLGPGNALSYMLAEEGYDVWLLNARGNFHSRNHTTLNPDTDNSFWAFSWDEIGRYDIPAYIDYILALTGETKVHYIGHSQGGTSFLTFASLRPEYNEKIISFQGLAPAAFFHNNRHPVFLLLAPYERMLESLANRLGIYEVLARNPILTPILMAACSDGMPTQMLCLLFVENDLNRGTFNTTMFPAFLGHAPSGAALRQVTHYGQCINSGTFSRYNYGTLQNLAIYGRITPPQYDLSLITAKTYLHYGRNDLEVNYNDILYLAEVMRNAETVEVPRIGFTHYDFIWGMDAREQVFETVVAKMREAENLCRPAFLCD